MAKHPLLLWARSSLLLLAVLLVPACGGGGGGGGGGTALRTVLVQGKAQKGPLITGSSVDVHMLNSTLDPTGTIFSSQISTNQGAFSLSNASNDPFMEVIAQGFFFDEISNALSPAPIVLRGLASADSTNDVRVNLLTTAVKDRIKHLVGLGQAFDAAATQAKTEVFQVFDIDAASFNDLIHLDLTGTTASDAALIAVSAVLLQYAGDHSANPAQKVAQLALALSTLSLDLEPDGAVSATSSFRKNLAGSAHRVDPLAVKANLETYYSNLGSPITVPDLAPSLATFSERWPWRFGPELPNTFSRPAGCAVGGKIYVIGGIDGSVPSATGSVSELDPATGTWTYRTDMPTPRFEFTCAAVNGILYAIGGRDVSSTPFATVESYNPTTNQWAPRTSMPTARSALCSAVVNGKIYVFGGQNASQSLSTVEVYDPATNLWAPRMAMTTARSHAGCAAIGNDVYVVGGSAMSASNIVEKYDTVANSWTSRAGLSSPRAGPAVGAVGGALYAVGGSDGSGMVALNEWYNPVSNLWQPRTPMDFSRLTPLTAVFGGEVWILGSWGLSPTPTHSIEIYDPSKDN